MKKRIVFATGNEGKMKEIRMILADIGVPVVSMKEAGIVEKIEENGTTFEQNAAIKARRVMELTGEMAMADDSGLEIDYFDGAPGIYSARFMGEDTPYEVKNSSIIEKMRDAGEEERTARFVCAIACAMPDGTVLSSRGVMEGRIAHEIKGENGFGYDPIFYLPECGCTSAEITPEKKNELSHRGKALRDMKEKLRNYLNQK